MMALIGHCGLYAEVQDTSGTYFGAIWLALPHRFHWKDANGGIRGYTKNMSYDII